MKQLLLFGMLSMSAHFVQAQKISAGPEGGLNFTGLRMVNAGEKVDNKMRFGFKIGGIINAGMGRHLSLQPGLFYSVKGAKNTYTTKPTIDNVTYDQENTVFTKVNYLEIPLNLQWELQPLKRKSFFLGAGPYVAFAVSGETEKRIVRDDGKMTTTNRIVHGLAIGNDVTDDIRKTDAGLNVNVGYRITKGFYMRANAGVGLMNLTPKGDKDNSSHSLAFGLSVGYLLGK